MQAKFFLERMKVDWDEGGRRILLGNNTRGGAVMLQPIRFQCVRVQISTALPCTYIYGSPHVYSVLTCASSELCLTF